MRTLVAVITMGLFTITFYSCTCAYLDCVTDDYYGQFRIVRATDSTDLVFGRHRIYDKDLIRFYTLKSTDTVFFDVTPYGYSLNAPEDSLLLVRFYPKSDTAYMRLGNGDINTLVLSFKTLKTKCCGTITEITNFRLNNAVDLPGDAGTQVIKK